VANSEGVANTNLGPNFATSSSAFDNINASAIEFDGDLATDGLASRGSVAAESTSVSAGISRFLPITFKITAGSRGETASHRAQSRSWIALFGGINNSISAKMIERGRSNG